MKRNYMSLICAFLVLILVAGCAPSAEVRLNEGKALEKLDALRRQINSRVVEHQPDSNWIGKGSSVDELPPISKYPESVKGNGQINVEIFSSTEKSSTSKEGSWMEAMAKGFNAQNLRVNGKTVSVSVRPIASGLGLNYITTRKYIPDAYSPANELWGEMIRSTGVVAEMVTDRLTGNVAGFLLKKPAYKEYTAKYGKVTVEGVTKAVMAKDLTPGHPDPNVSSTGLNITTAELRVFDPNNPFSEKSLAQYRQFLDKIPPASPTTAEMAEVAEKGILDAMAMEAQAYSGKPALVADWVFTPAGVRHDSPVYALDNLSAEKKEVLQLFVKYCQTPEAQKSATSFGFNKYDNYKGVPNKYSGAELFTALKAWKANKDGGRPVISVFVVDRSGSMAGEKLNRVKVALQNSLQYINPENHIGLVSYSSGNDITIDLPVAEFTPKQRALFAGAIKDIQSDGNTATNDALVVALDMAIKAQAKVPNSKIRILVLSDGERTEGLSNHDVLGLVNGIGLPVYGVGFHADLTELEELAKVNEGYCIDADSEDVVYQLRNLFTAEL